jgi:hypothetical protein
MKGLLFILLFSGVLFAQNPDGRKPSLHFTPYISNYSITDNITGQPVGTFETTFNFELMLKVPVNQNITLSPFYRSYSLKSTYYPYWPYYPSGANSVSTSYGFTLSYYFD